MTPRYRHTRRDASERVAQLVAEAATCKAHNQHKRRISMPSTRFEPAMPAIKRLQTAWPPVHFNYRTQGNLAPIAVVGRTNRMFVYHQCKSNREGLPVGGGTCCLQRQCFAFDLCTHTDNGGRQGCPQPRYTFAR
jgi:hypothetical protein